MNPVWVAFIVGIGVALGWLSLVCFCLLAAPSRRPNPPEAPHADL